MITINEYKQRQQLIIVDIQPEYKNAIDMSFDISDFITYLKKSIDAGIDIYYFYNGESVGGEYYKLVDYLIENGLDKYYLDEIYFFDKAYGYFRQLIDEDYTDELIVILKYMINNNIRDANDIKDSNIIPDNIRSIIENDPLYYQEVIDEIKNIPKTNNILVGGGEYECLAEVEAILKALNYDFIKNYDFIY